MKRLLYFFVVVYSCELSAQSFPVKNVNDEYFVSNIYNPDVLKQELHEWVRDKNGLYWFQFFTEIYSFDGANWKSYKLKSPNSSDNPFRINDLETTDDGNIWLGTEYGFYVYDRASDQFVSIKEKFPAIKNFRHGVSCTFRGPTGTFIYLGVGTDGFYLVDINTKKIRHIVIDSMNKVFISSDGEQIISDKSGNIWGTTKDYRGIWHYNVNTQKVRCSWKGELPHFIHKRFQHFINMTYSEKENVLWIAHVDNRYLEKMNLATGKSIFYSFFDQLSVRADTNVIGRHRVFMVKIDRDNNKWINVSGRIVKLDSNISRMEYLFNDRETFPVGDLTKFKPETGIENDRNEILLWVHGLERLSMIKKRRDIVRHIFFDTLSVTGVMPADYLNPDSYQKLGRQNIFLEKGRNDQYLLLQQNQDRPKLICFDKNLRIKGVLLNEEWKRYPAYFSKDFDPDTTYIAVLRPEIEPLNFRNVVLKDFRIDLRSLKAEEIELDFKERVRRYGQVDKNDVYWLFSNGYLYAYNAREKMLDSIFICKPSIKGSARENLIKGFDYPTLLHKNSSTFWISFFPSKELYKINLVAKKIEKIFKPCMDEPDCNIPGGVYGLTYFDSSRIYLKSSLHGMLLNTKTDSVSGLSDLFQKRIPVERPVGTTVYRNWICMVYPSGIYLCNKVSGTQRQLLLDEDYKWKIMLVKSMPLINDHGEMILMSNANKGFLVFNIDSPIVRSKPGIVKYSSIKVDDKQLLLDSLATNRGLVLKYNRYNRIQISFSDYSVFVPGKTNYEYALYKGGDTIWNKVSGKPELNFSDLSPGKYQLVIRANNTYGDYSEKSSVISITILPPYWQTWWFRSLGVVVIGLVFYALYRFRLHQLKRLQTIRNNIASDLHDDIGSTLNSISIYSEVAKQQAGKEIPALDLIGINSRKIIENMSDIVWTINPENDSFEKIITRMRSFAHQLLKAKKVEYTFEVNEKIDGVVLPMQVRKNFYLVFKEAITNVVKYSEASRVSILLFEKNKIIILRIRDNGKGIPVNAQTLGNGLMNMTRRAKEINAELNIITANGAGTEIELTLKT